ncbi:hypothetical protein LSUCC1028_00335 [Rhodobacterales bacterium LSUCC1028]|nr:hypothetical protein [Rhodobacterales bacterium LSUCC1028]
MNKSKFAVSLCVFAALNSLGQMSFGQSLVNSEGYETFLYSEVSSIPINDATKFEDAFGCFLETPTTTEGSAISDNGWAVTSEVKFANYTFVSFNGRIDVGTSGTCWKAEGNIAVFLNSDLQGVIYTNDPTNTSIGRLNLHEGGIIRLHTGEPTDLPVLDIQYASDQFTMSEVSEFTTYCEGRHLVPNVYEEDISEARHGLLQMGWKPNTSRRESDEIGFIAERMRQEGITEVVGCSGTGMGYCRYEYNQNNAVLVVTSIEPRRVTHVSVRCSNN